MKTISHMGKQRQQPGISVGSQCERVSVWQ